MERPWMYGHHDLPIQAIRDFHASKARIRLLSANNRGGKSTRGAWELVCFATGWNPIRKESYPTPNICWAVSLDNKNYGHVIEERLKEWLPDGTIWREAKRYFQIPKKYGGSRIYLKSAEPGETKFAAEGILAAWFDEGRDAMEGPFMETLARLKPGWPLRVFITMTPEDGSAGWTWRKFYDPDSKERFKDAEIFYFNIYDCSTEKGGHITPQEIEDFKNQFPEWKWPAKLYGRPGTMASNPYFRSDYIDRVQLKCDQAQPGRIEFDAIGNMSWVDDDTEDIFMLRPPVKGRRYLMPIDMGGGVGRDYTCAAVLDLTDMAEVAYFKSNTKDVELASLSRILPLGRFYNHAMALPETNAEHGSAFLTLIREKKYRPIYRRRKWSTLRRDYLSEYGWRTESGSRNLIYDAWATAIREDNWTFSKDALHEARLVSEIEGRPDHPKGRHDDHFFTVGIGLAAILQRSKLGLVPQRYETPKWTGEDAYQYAV